jgi:nucleoside-triphosphatase THEP1
MAGEGSFVQTTQVWDVDEIYSMDIKSPEFKELLVRMYQNLNDIAVVLNTKDTGYYPLFEMVNSQLWFPDDGV